MALFMLDTNICIYLMKNQPPQVARRFAQCVVGDVVMSAITYAELEYGVAMSATPAQEKNNLLALIEFVPVVHFDVAAARSYGPVRAATRHRTRDHLDKLIASHAISLGLVLVTNNIDDFRDFPGIALENWLDG